MVFTWCLHFFYSNLNNVIDLEEFPNTNPGYKNYDDRSSKGIEFEYSFHSKLKHFLYFNASYINTGYTIPPEPGEASINQSMPDISKVMLKAMYIYNQSAKLSLGTIWRYYSQSTATKLTWIHTDPTTRAVHIFDETLTYKLSAKDTFRGTVKNIFDADIRNPSYYYRANGGLKRENRNYFVSYIHNF